MASPSTLRVIDNNGTFVDSEERADGDDEQEEHLAEEVKKIIKHVFKFGGPLLHDTMADIRIHLPFRSLKEKDIN